MKLLISAIAACTLFLAWCREGSLVQRAPSGAEALNNPLGESAEAQRAGAKLYARECAACHGGNRKGSGKTPPLNRPEVYQAAPGVLFWVLRNGSLRTGMPSFAHLPEPERWQIITFLRQSGAPERNENGHSR